MAERRYPVVFVLNSARDALALVIRHQTGTRTSPKGRRRRKKYVGIVVDRGNIAFLRWSNYSRAKVSFFCRLCSVAGKIFSPRREKAQNTESGEERNEEKRRRYCFLHRYRKFEAKDRWLGVSRLLSFFFLFPPSLTVSLCTQLSEELHFWLRGLAICVPSCLSARHFSRWHFSILREILDLADLFLSLIRLNFA